MTDTELDLLEIKQTLKDMKKNIKKIENTIKDDFYNQLAIDLQYTDKTYKYKCKIDDIMNQLLSIQKETNDSHIDNYITAALVNLHNCYIDLCLDEEK